MLSGKHGCMMENSDIKAECEQELAAIARNKKFWEQHISWLEKQDVRPSKDDVDWVKKHVEGLDAACRWLKDYIVKIEQRQNAPRS